MGCQNKNGELINSSAALEPKTLIGQACLWWQPLLFVWQFPLTYSISSVKSQLTILDYPIELLAWKWNLSFPVLYNS
jgi:hypothetical protein